MSRGKKKRTLRDLSRDKWDAEDWTALVQEIRSTSDRGATIIIASHIEDQLATAIEHCLKQKDDDTLSCLYERDGALSTMFSTIHLAYAMGIIDSTMRKDLDIIRRIRNAFAHAKRPVTFQTPEIQAAIGKLSRTKTERDDTNKVYDIIMEGTYDARTKTNFILMAKLVLLAEMNHRYTKQALRTARRRLTIIQNKKRELQAKTSAN